MKLVHFLTFLLLFHCSRCFLRGRFNRIKEKAADYYKKNFKKDKTWNFLGLDPSEYPGGNKKYQQQNAQKWEVYYECLKEQESTIGLHGSPIPEAIQGYDGGSVRFDCKLCLSPLEEENIESVEWYFAGQDQEYLSPIVYDEHILLSPQTKTLQIYNLKFEHMGQYVCILGDAVTAPYYLTVVSSSSDVLQVYPESSKKKPHPTEVEVVKEYRIIVATEWGDWSPCSTCGKVGRRHQVGYCVVFYDVDTNKTERGLHYFKQALLNESFGMPFQKSKVKNNEKHDKQSDEAIVELLRIFVYGIPCKSHILPDVVKNLPPIRNRKDEVMVGYCKVPCAAAKVFEVKDKNGNVLELANNSAGVYSMIQGVPPVSPSVERQLQYERLGDKVTLVCPGNLNTETPIQWQLKSKIIVPEIIFKESNGSIYITPLDHIQFRKVKVSDSNLYSCWQNNELAGTINLIVEPKIKLTFNHHIMIVGMVLILSTFAYVFMRACAGRKHVKGAVN